MSRAHCGALQKARWKAYYGAQPARTEQNRKRKLARHIGQHLGCLQSQEVYKKRYGADSLKSLLYAKAE